MLAFIFFSASLRSSHTNKYESISMMTEINSLKRPKNTDDYIGASSFRRFFKTPVSVLRLHSFRGFIMLQTYLSIFAVDFSIYPLRFIKTETIGISLMDVGVGCYIFLNSYSLLFRRQQQQAVPSSKQPVSPQKFCQTFIEKVSTLCNIYKKSWPLLVLGFGRLLAIKGINYHEHISEYGIHWNFFMTMAGLIYITSTLQIFLPEKILFLVDVGIMLVYQSVLTFSSTLESFIFSDEARQTLFEQNKEGIFSLIGYTFIHLTGFLLLSHVATDFLHSRITERLLAKVFILVSTLWSLYFFSKDVLGIIPSRRSGNLSFGLWIIAFCVTHTASLLPIEFILGPQPVLLFRGISRNPLVTFLFANILTGLLNLSCQSLLLSDIVAYFLVILYAFLVCLFCYLLDEYFDISLR